MIDIAGILEPVAGVFGKVIELVDELHTSEEEKAKIKAEIVKMQNEAIVNIAGVMEKVAEIEADVVKTEATGHSWLQRNWRPITMMVFVFIVFYNYVFAPIFGVKALPTPPALWEVIKIGLGGYVIGRSLEKIAINGSGLKSMWEGGKK